MNEIKNSVMLIGRLGADPKFVSTSTGRQLVELSLATTDSYRNKEGEWIDQTEWHRCIAWGKLAELLNKLCHKGQELVVRGKLSYNTYEDKDGQRRKIPQVVISEFATLDSKGKKADNTEQAARAQ